MIKCFQNCRSGIFLLTIFLVDRYNAPRAVSCIAHSDVALWKVDQLTFRYIVAHNVNSQQQSMREFVKSLDVFVDMPEDVVNRFVSAMTRVQWKSGDLIVQKGEKGKVFYIIIEGRVKVYDIGLGDSIIDDQILEAGQGFGELSLLTGEPRAASVVAVTDVTTMAIDRATFEEHLGPMKRILEHSMRKRILKALPIFLHSNVTEPEIDHLVDLMVEVCYCKGEHLAQAGKPYQMKLWIIRHGTVVAFSNHNPDKIFTLKSGDYFGDKSIKGDPTHIASFTAVCEENVAALVLTREDIESVIGDIERLGESRSFVKTRNEIRIRFEDLQKHRILGMGGFGVVWLVSHKNEKTPYALKAISKRKLLEANQVQSVIREKELLRNLQHIFIVQLVASYQDENTLFLLLPVISGGELFSRVQKCKTRTRGLRNNEAAFYAACVIEAIGHFHHHSIAYRDLKLENVLIGEDGYCVIVDLGFAKIVPDQTFTLVGTPEYIAPEIILSKGYDKSVDYWSYGVLVYELLVGVSPFFKFGSTRMAMFKRIVMVDFTFPIGFGEEAEVLVRKLLVRRPCQRLGNLANGYIDIKKCDWFDFSGIDFKAINRKTAEVPWKPLLKDPLKLKDFDSYHESKADQGKPLTEEEQSLFSGF